MSQEWETLARQIADLKRQRDEALRQLHELQAVFDTGQDLVEATLAQAELWKAALAEVTAERDMWRAAYELQDLQRRTVKGDHHVH